MKFEIQQEALQRSLDLVAAVVPGKTTLPILTSVLVEADADGLTFSATNLDISMVTRSAEAEVSKTGRAAMPANKLVPFVRNLSPGPVQVEVTDGNLKIKAGKASFQESCRNVEEYPKLPDTAAGDGHELPADLLISMINQTSYAVSKDETRPALMGILWEVRPDSLTMVATDAHRLARSSREVTWSFDGERNLIVDTGGLRHLPRMAETSSRTSSIEVFFGDNQLSFRAGETLLHVRLLEGPFPDYTAVIPKDNDKIVTVDREALSRGIRRVCITADRITSQIRLGVEAGRLVLSARGSDGSHAEDEVAVAYDGEAMEIGFNYNYLQDVLKNVGSDSVQFSLRNPEHAALVVPADDEGNASDDLLCLLMPLRLAGD